jgi:hypothetical protein
VEELLSTVIGVSGSTGSTLPLSVQAASQCNCYFRALRWLEQYGISQQQKVVGAANKQPSSSAAGKEPHSSITQKFTNHECFSFMEVKFSSNNILCF